MKLEENGFLLIKIWRILNLHNICDNSGIWRHKHSVWFLIPLLIWRSQRNVLISIHHVSLLSHTGNVEISIWLAKYPHKVHVKVVPDLPVVLDTILILIPSRNPAPKIFLYTHFIKIGVLYVQYFFINLNKGSDIVSNDLKYLSVSEFGRKDI